MINAIKLFVFKLFLLYDKIIPIQRGKFFISKIITRAIGEVNIKTDNGVWLRIIPLSPMDKSYLDADNLSHQIILQEIGKLNKGDVYMDVGANIGFYAFIASRIVGKEGLIYCFEPSKREYSRLLAGEELNKINNIVSFNCGLSDNNSISKLDVNQYHTGLNRFDENDTHVDEGLPVPVFRADHLISQKQIHLVKIDVEGAEFKVVKGLKELLSNRKITKLIIEITPSFLEKYSSSKNELYSFLEQYGYKPLINSKEWQYDEIFVLDEHH